jgi:hypothetical protein
MQQLLERGVYLVPCFDEDGYRYLAVVNSQHRCIHKQRLFNLTEKKEQARGLWRWLNRVDPLPHSLVQAETQSPQFP